MSVPWLENGWGWVEIYSYKRDVEAAKIRELREDRDKFVSSIDAIRSEDSALDDEIEDENSKADAYSRSHTASMLEELKINSSIQGPPQFSVPGLAQISGISQHLAYMPRVSGTGSIQRSQ